MNDGFSLKLGVGSLLKQHFRRILHPPRANNYKRTHGIFRKKQVLSNQARNQKRFHEYYLQNDHNGIRGWKITMIDHAETVKSLRQKNLYWYHKLKTYAPFGFNERDVYAEY